MSRLRSSQTADRRPPPSGATELVMDYFIPFLSGFRELWPASEKVTLWPTVPANTQQEISDEFIVRIRQLVRPIFEFYVGQYYSDFVKEDLMSSIDEVFIPEDCYKLFEDSFWLYKMLSVVAVDRSEDDVHRRADDELLRWVRENVGQLVLVVERWEYRGESLLAPKPKRVDLGSGAEYFDWGRPQLISLLIYWLAISFDKAVSGKRFPNGEYYVGICKKCRKPFKKGKVGTECCPPCNRRK